MTSRLVRTEIEVPGTPEEVWEAIATGPGIACWFVPADGAHVDGPLVAGVVERALDEMVLLRDGAAPTASWPRH